jgi:hypothetical protein
MLPAGVLIAAFAQASSGAALVPDGARRFGGLDVFDGRGGITSQQAPFTPGSQEITG